MKNLFLIYFLIVLAFGLDEEIDLSKVHPDYLYAPLNNDSSVPQNDSTARIAGGSVATPHAFPYTVGLALYDTVDYFWCGGGLISTKYVLTAAHCLSRKYDATVYLGTHDILVQTGGELRIKVFSNNFIMHPGWSERQRFKDDIGLVQLPYHVQLNYKIRLVSLPHRSLSQEQLEGKLVVATGWGKPNDQSNDLSRVLRYAYLAVTSQSFCWRYHGKIVRPTVICTSGYGGKSVCDGDSGGPIVLEGPGGSTTIVGVASFIGIDGCQKSWPTGSSRVTSYLDWISSHTGIPIRN